MADNEANNEEPVILDYRLPASTLRLLYIRFAAMASIAFLFTIIVVLMRLSPIYFLMPACLAVLLKLEAKTIVATLECYNSGIRMETLAGKPTTASWKMIREFSRKSTLWRKYCIIVTDGNSKFILYNAPDEKLTKFSSLLRESGNARIIGFD